MVVSPIKNVFLVQCGMIEGRKLPSLRFAGNSTLEHNISLHLQCKKQKSLKLAHLHAKVLSSLRAMGVIFVSGSKRENVAQTSPPLTAQKNIAADTLQLAGPSDRNTSRFGQCACRRLKYMFCSRLNPLLCALSISKPNLQQE